MAISKNPVVQAAHKLFSGITVFSLIALSFGPAVTLPSFAFADTVGSIDFESYSTGSVHNQNGWSSSGPYDQEVVSNDTSAPASFGTQSLRISNEITTGSFGDQTFAAPLSDSVGESDSTAGIFSEGTKMNHFEAEFDIASTKPDEQQSGLAISVSPDRGDGSRMSYLNFSDVVDGINITFFDVQGDDNPANFVSTDLGTYDRDEPHTIKMTLDTLDGPGNDIVKIWIDGVLVHTGTSWENYYRYDSEANAEQSPRIVKTLIFRSAGTAAPANTGNGFLFDNLTLSSSTAEPEPEMYVFPSTNEKNKDKQVPNREGQDAPYVEQTDIQVGETTLEFVNQAPGLAAFEYRIDGLTVTSGTPHPVVTGDFIYPTISVNSGNSTTSVFSANEYVEVRLALGGERDWDFDWTRFDVLLPVDPEGKNQLNLSGFKFNNKNEDRDQDSGEERLPGWEMRLYVEGEEDWELVASDVTDENGKYKFSTQQEAGVYHICEISQLGWHQVRQDWSGTSYHVVTENESPNAGEEGAYCSTLTYTDESDKSSKKNFGNAKNDPSDSHQFNISGHKFHNKNEDRDQDDGEENLPGWEMRLYKIVDDVWEQIGTDVTDEDGEYKFPTQHEAGLYRVCEVEQDGWHQVKQDWSGTPFHIVTENQSPNVGEEGEWCAAATYTDEGDRSTKKYFGNKQETPEDTTPPTAPEIIFPLPEQSFDSTPILNDWTDSTDASGIEKYEIEYVYDDGHTFSNAPFRETTASQRNHVPGSGEQGGVTIRVRAYDNEGNVSDWSNSVHYFYDESTPATQYSTVAMCKVDDEGNDLEGWTLILANEHVENLEVFANSVAGTDSSSLIAGISYIAKAMGTFLNQNGANVVDAEYSTIDNWATQMDGFTGFGEDILDLQIAKQFVNWGVYNGAHTYATAFIPAVADVVNFRVFDGQNGEPNEGWYGDNDGTLDVDISKGFAGITGADGCVVFQNVPYGTYEVGEIMQDGWENVDGLGAVEVDEAEETFTVTNNLVDTGTGGGGDGGGDDEPSGPTTSSQTIQVFPGDMAMNLGDVFANPTSWFFYNDETDEIDNSLGGFVNGPATAPLGDGSAQISVVGTERRNLATYQFSGIPLEEIEQLKFSTYNPSAGNGGSVNRSAYLNFNVDFDGSDTWQSRLVFVPSDNDSVTQDAWQEWDAIDGGNALWKYSGSVWPGTSDLGLSTTKTWNEILTEYPDVRTRISDPWLGLRVGEPYANGYTENLDKFVITVNDGSNATTTTYDFEPLTWTTTTITNEDELATASVVNEPFRVAWEVSPNSLSGDGTVDITFGGGGTSCDDVPVGPNGIGECFITPTATSTGMNLVVQYSGGDGFAAGAPSTPVPHDVIEETTGPTISFTPLLSVGGGGPVGLFGTVNNSFGGGGQVLGASTGPQGENLGSGPACEDPYLSDYLHEGDTGEQVGLLQAFLNGHMNAGLNVSGTFGTLTTAAVNSFQTLYASDILEPWGLTQPTGHVYYTTQKKINEITCEESFPLTEAQHAEIERARTANEEGNSSMGDDGSSTDSAPQQGEQVPEEGEETGGAGGSEDQTALVGSSETNGLLERLFERILEILGK